MAPAPTLRLYWHPFSIIPRRVRILFREKGIAYEDVAVDLPGGAHQAPAFRRLNPFGKIPVLEDGDFVLCESVAIMEYLEERFPTPSFRATALAARALTRQFMLWSGDYMIGSWETWMGPVIHPERPVDTAARDHAFDAFAAHLDVLERRLSGRAWLIDDYSLADMCYAPMLTVFDRIGLGALIDARPAVAAWVTRLCERPAVRDTAPPFISLSLPPRS